MAPGVARSAVIAEDDYELRALLASVLIHDGFDVTEVANGVALVEAVGRMHACGAAPDLIVTDVEMPHQDGLTALAAMGGTALGVPVIVVTAFANGEARAHAERLGAAAILSKPFNLDQLRALAHELTCMRHGAPC